MSGQLESVICGAITQVTGEPCGIHMRLRGCRYHGTNGPGGAVILNRIANNFINNPTNAFTPIVVPNESIIEQSNYIIKHEPLTEINVQERLSQMQKQLKECLADVAGNRSIYASKPKAIIDSRSKSLQGMFSTYAYNNAVVHPTSPIQDIVSQIKSQEISLQIDATTNPDIFNNPKIANTLINSQHIAVLISLIGSPEITDDYLIKISERKPWGESGAMPTILGKCFLTHPECPDEIIARLQFSNPELKREVQIAFAASVDRDEAAESESNIFDDMG